MATIRRYALQHITANRCHTSYPPTTSAAVACGPARPYWDPAPAAPHNSGGGAGRPRVAAAVGTGVPVASVQETTIRGLTGKTVEENEGLLPQMP